MSSTRESLSTQGASTSATAPNQTTHPSQPTAPVPATTQQATLDSILTQSATGQTEQAESTDHLYSNMGKRDLPKFGARQGERIEEFLYHFEAYWELHPSCGERLLEAIKKGDYLTSVEKQKERALVLSFKLCFYNGACEKFRVYMEQHPGVKYRHVRQWLLDTYSNTVEKNTAALEMMQFHLQRNDTLETYTERFEQLAQQVGNLSESPFTTSLYVRGLSIQRLVTLVMQREPNSVQDAHKAARVMLATDPSLQQEFEQYTGRPYNQQSVLLHSPYGYSTLPTNMENVLAQLPLQLAMVMQQLVQPTGPSGTNSFSQQNINAYTPQPNQFLNQPNSNTNFNPNSATNYPGNNSNRNNSNYGSRNRGPGPRPYCTNCGRYGHDNSTCRLYVPRDTTNQQPSSNSASQSGNATNNTNPTSTANQNPENQRQGKA